MQPLGDCGDTERDTLRSLRNMGVTHTGVTPMNQGFPDPAAHIDAIRRYCDSVASNP